MGKEAREREEGGMEMACTAKNDAIFALNDNPESQRAVV